MMTPDHSTMHKNEQAPCAISPVKAWIERLGGRPKHANSFVSSDFLAVGHYEFDGLRDEVEAPAIPFHYISVTLTNPLQVEARLDGAYVKTRIMPGQSIIMAAGHTNTWRWDRPTEEAHVFLSADFVDRVAQISGDDSVDIADRTAFNDMSLRNTILALTEEIAHLGAISKIFFDMAGELVARRILQRHSSRVTRAASMKSGALTARQLRKVLNVVQDRLSEDISLDELAGAAGLSRFHFIRAFNSAVGTSPHRWLVSLRIARAKELLMTRNKSIIDVASQVGFESQSHFGQVFLDHVGICPSEWRRRVLS